MIVAESLKKQIFSKLAHLTAETKLHNKTGLFDINKSSEDFFMELMNLTLSLNLQNTNNLKSNYPAIDLADHKNRLCIQITSETSGRKISSTISNFTKYKLNAAFDSLLFIIISTEKRPTIQTKEKVTIMNVADLAKHICANKTLEQLHRIYDFLVSRLGDNINLNKKFLSKAELQQRACNDAEKIILAKNNNQDSFAIHAELLSQFKREYQPFLSDKAFSALFKNYTNFMMDVLERYFTPHTYKEKNIKMLTARDIPDGQEIYRQNYINMPQDQWALLISEVTELAIRYANETADLAISGVETKRTTESHDLEFARLTIEYGLTTDESTISSDIFRKTYLTTLKNRLENT